MNLFTRAFNFVKQASSARTITALGILLLLAAIPLTVFIAQQQQDIRQRASTPDQCHAQCNPAYLECATWCENDKNRKIEEINNRHTQCTSDCRIRWGYGVNEDPPEYIECSAGCAATQQNETTEAETDLNNCAYTHEATGVPSEDSCQVRYDRCYTPCITTQSLPTPTTAPPAGCVCQANGSWGPDYGVCGSLAGQACTSAPGQQTCESQGGNCIQSQFQGDCARIGTGSCSSGNICCISSSIPAPFNCPTDTPTTEYECQVGACSSGWNTSAEQSNTTCTPEGLTCCYKNINNGQPGGAPSDPGAGSPGGTRTEGFGISTPSGNCRNEYAAGGKFWHCQQTQGPCASNAGVGVPYVCNPDGGWSNANPSGECSTLCKVSSSPGGSPSGGSPSGGSPVGGTDPTPVPTALPGQPENCDPSKVNMSVFPTNATVGSQVTFSISGTQGSTHVGDTWSGGVNCSGGFAGNKSCNTTANGTFTWTHTWRNCLGSLSNCSSTQCSKSQTFTVGSAATPTPTPIITQPPAGPGDTQLAFNLTLSGIQAGRSLVTSARNIQVELFNDAGNLVTTKVVSNVLQYTSSTGKFAATVNMGGITQGNYIVKVKTERYLKKRAPGIITIPSTGSTITVQETTLIAGDTSGDNKIDIQDYNIIIGCFGNKANTASCTNKTNADLDDNGSIDEVDYNVFVRSLGVQTGD